MKAVLVPTDTPVYEGECDKNGALVVKEECDGENNDENPETQDENAGNNDENVELSI